LPSHPALHRLQVCLSGLAFIAALGACDNNPAGVDDPCDLPDVAFPARATGVIAITNANLISMDGHADVERGRTILVRNGTIEAIGEAGSVAIPSGATVIDGSCRFVMPGLADMHVHLVYASEPLLYVANGITTVREMWGSTEHISYRERVNSGELIGPSMIIGSPGMDGVGSWPRAIVITNPAKADTLVAQLVRDKFDFIKVYESLSGEVYDAIAVAAAKRGMPIAGHVGAAVGIDRALASGQRSIEHMATAFLPEIRAAGNTTGWWDSQLDDSKARALAQRIERTGVWVTPTLGTLRAMLTTSEEVAFHSRPESRYLAPALLAEWVARGPWASAAIREATITNESRMTRFLFEAGVHLLVGTDAGFTYVTPGFAINDELEMLVAAGLEPTDVLLAATHGAAEFLQKTNEFGAVRNGLRADLLLLDQNPLHDVANVGLRAGVMTNGRWYSQAELQRLLDMYAALTTAGDRNELIANRDFVSR
jgi:imidazolonepropionase-like amidohydrolase